jgi:hypothetical protein
MSYHKDDKTMVQNKQNNQKTIYESIFGGEGYSLTGPIFYLAMGAFCILIVFLLLVSEIYFPDVVANIQSIRPDIKFPFYGIVLILGISGAIIGILFGFIGIFWHSWKN